MVTVDTGDLTVLALAGGDPETPVEPRSAVELSERLEMGAETMADRITLLSTLSELEDEEVVEQASGSEERAYRLTERGQQRARELYEEVRDRRIEIRNGTSEEIRLADVDAHLSEPAIVRALARLSDDDVLYLKETVEEAFVNRERELDRLQELLDQLQMIEPFGPGEGSAVLVSGEAGVGKTSLVEEFLSRSEGCEVLSGVCQGDTDEPYRALRDAIEPALTESPFDRPEVDLEDEEDLENMRTSLFADVADALLELASSDEPVVLYLDDLHNTGKPTIELLEFLSRRVPDGQVLVVGTIRLESVEDDHPIHELAQNWDDSETNEHLPLAPFGREETRELIEQVLETRPIPAAFAELVYEHTGGNSLFVEETLSALQEAAVLVPDHDVYPEEIDDTIIPDRVEETIATRLEALDEDGRELLSVAALLGEEFTVGRLETVLDHDETTIREYLDVLVNVDVLRWADDADEHQRLWFQSGLFREMVTETLSDDNWTAYHRRIATTLAERVDDEPERAAKVAYHYEQAGVKDNALKFWLQAAERSESNYAQELALDQYERALAIAREDGDSQQILDIVESIGGIALLLGEADRSKRAFEYIMSETEAPDRRQRAARDVARTQLRWEGDPQAAFETITEALPSELTPSTAEQCRLLIQRSQVRAHEGDYDEAIRELETVVEAADELGDPAIEAEALNWLVADKAQHKIGISRESLERARRAVSIFDSLGRERKKAQAYNSVGLAQMELGNETEAKRSFEQAMDAYEATGDRAGALVGRQNSIVISFFASLNGEYPVEKVIGEIEDALDEAHSLGNDYARAHMIGPRGILEWQGRYDYASATDWLGEALELVEELEYPRGILFQSTMLASVHETAGKAEAARALIDQVKEYGEQTEIPIYWSWGYRLDGRLAKRDGSHEAAIQAFERAVEIASEHDAFQAELVARAELTDALLSSGDLERSYSQATWIQDRLEEGQDSEHQDDPGERTELQAYVKPTIEGYLAVGKAARARGDYTQAKSVLDHGLSRARDQDDRWREAKLLFEIAATHDASGDSETACEFLEQALSVTDELGVFGEELQRRNAELLALR